MRTEAEAEAAAVATGVALERWRQGGEGTAAWNSCAFLRVCEGERSNVDMWTCCLWHRGSPRTMPFGCEGVAVWNSCAFVCVRGVEQCEHGGCGRSGPWSGCGMRNEAKFRVTACSVRSNEECTI